MEEPDDTIDHEITGFDLMPVALPLASGAHTMEYVLVLRLKKLEEEQRTQVQYILPPVGLLEMHRRFDQLAAELRAHAASQRQDGGGSPTQ
jgi:hypothetical protein